jgi:hypothetical protein
MGGNAPEWMEMMTGIGLNWVNIVLGLVLPMLVALVTANAASGAVKAIFLAFLAALGGFVQEFVDAGALFANFDLDIALSNFVWTFLLAVGLHFGLLKPIGITGKDNAIANTVPGGVGSTDSRPIG